jgi:hypothetical protein
MIDMAEESAAYGEINPHRVYNLQGAARATGMSTRWVQDNLIDPEDGVMYRKKGDCKLIPGWVLVQWVESDLRRKCEWQEQGDEDEAPKTKPRKSASKP